MATAQEQAQVNTGVANANLLVARLGASYVTWDGDKGRGTGKLVRTKIYSEFAALVNANITPLYSSGVPISQAATTLTNFTVRKNYYPSRFANPISADVYSLTLWNAQYIAWSIQLPVILQLGGIDNNKAPVIINSFSVWYIANIGPLIPMVRITGGFK